MGEYTRMRAFIEDFSSRNVVELKIIQKKVVKDLDNSKIIRIFTL